MKFFIPVNPQSVKECQLCGNRIVFVERRKGGLWFPTDLVLEEETQSWGYFARGQQREVAFLHQCFGDPEDPTTINGKKEVLLNRMKVLEEKISNFYARPQIIVGRDLGSPARENSQEYQDLISEYEMTRNAYIGYL